jgi:hypothetical protein
VSEPEATAPGNGETAVRDTTDVSSAISR